MMSPLLIPVFLIICVPANHYFLCIRSGLHPMSALILAFRLSMLRLWLMVTQCSFFHPTSFIFIISFSGSLSMFLSAVSIVFFNCSIYFVSNLLFYEALQWFNELIICYRMSLCSYGYSFIRYVAHSRIVIFKFFYSVVLSSIALYTSYKKSSSKWSFSITSN